MFYSRLKTLMLTFKDKNGAAPTHLKALIKPNKSHTTRVNTFIWAGTQMVERTFPG